MGSDRKFEIAFRLNRSATGRQPSTGWRPDSLGDHHMPARIDIGAKACFFYCFFIFCPVTENEAKEHARVPRPLRGFPARRRGGRSTRKLTPLSAGLRQPARFNPSAPPMLGAGQWEKSKP